MCIKAITKVIRMTSSLAEILSVRLVIKNNSLSCEIVKVKLFKKIKELVCSDNLSWQIAGTKIQSYGKS